MRPPSRRTRLLLLLGVVAAIAAWQLVPHDPVPDWERTLKVVVYPENADGSRAAAGWIAALEPDRFAVVQRFFAEEAARHGLALERPFEFVLGDPVAGAPTAPDYDSFIDYVRWAVQLRLWAWGFDDQGLDPDRIVIARYRAPAAGEPDWRHSLGIPSMGLAIANLVADPEQRGLNDFIVAHELMHTVGADDLYDRRTGMPKYPEGFVDPDREPLYPQPAAALMAGRVPLAPRRSRQIVSLGKVVIIEQTASQAGWGS